MRIRLICVLPLLLSACDVMEPYTPPPKPQVKEWQGQKQGTIAADAAHTPAPLWWLSLGDATLNRLMQGAVANNHDIKIAQARMREARALSGRAAAELLPDIGVSGNVVREGSQESRGGLDGRNTRSEIGVSAAWDLDLFGSNRAELDASTANLGVAKADYRQTLQTLLADVARSYIELRAQQQLLSLTEKNLALQNDTLRATRLQYKAQAASKLDVLRAEAQVASTQAEIPTIRALLATKRHRIAVLSGQAPGAIDTMLMLHGPIPYFHDDLILATPVATMAERPDIQAAEFRLKEQAALKNARLADIFPKLSLSGFFGAGTATLFSSATPWSLGANLVAPLLNFGRIESEINAADARKMQAFHRYQKTVLEALEDVENSLVQYVEERQRLSALLQSAKSQKEAVRLARIKFEAGDAVFIDILVAEERLLRAESGAVQSRASVTRAAVNVYTAMGIVAPMKSFMPASTLQPLPKKSID